MNINKALEFAQIETALLVIALLLFYFVFGKNNTNPRVKIIVTILNLNSITLF